MARILIGNIKGPKGNQGIQGIQGPIGPVGPQGPLPPLANNGLTTQVGVAALDAAYGKTLADGLSSVNSEIGNVFYPQGTETFTGDLNTIINQGIYEKVIAESAVNGPKFYNYMLVIRSKFGNLTQLAIGYNSNRFAIRHRFDNVWRAWDEFGKSSEITTWVELNDFTNGSIISASDLHIYHNQMLKRIRICGNITTNAPMAAKTVINLMQITNPAYRPKFVTPVLLYNVNNVLVHGCKINTSGQMQFNDSTGTTGPVLLQVAHEYCYA